MISATLALQLSAGLLLALVAPMVGGLTRPLESGTSWTVMWRHPAYLYRGSGDEAARQPGPEVLVGLLMTWAAALAILALPLASPTSAVGGDAGLLVLVLALAVQPALEASRAGAAERWRMSLWLLAIVLLAGLVFLYSNQALSAWRPSTVVLDLGLVFLLCGDSIMAARTPGAGVAGASPGSFATSLRRVVMAALAATLALPFLPAQPVARIPALLLAVVVIAMVSAGVTRALGRLGRFGANWYLALAAFLLLAGMAFELFAATNPCGRVCAVFGHG